MVVGPDGALPLPWLAEPLSAALAQQRAHALLVHAHPGIGALEFSLTLAQAWLCEGGRATACGQCQSCKLVQAKMHPDLMLLMPEVQRQELAWPLLGDKADSAEADAEGSKARKKPSRQIRIDEVRLANEWMAKTTSRGGAKVLVLHPAQQLNVQAASALLKTLEEPPAAARIVLTASDPEHLLPTIRSRCQRLVLPPPTNAQALQWLQQQGVDDAAVLLAAASGRPLAALELQRAGITAQAWQALPAALARGDASAFATWPAPRVVDTLMRLCHDAMRVTAGGQALYFAASSLPVRLDMVRLVAWQQTLLRISRDDEHPWNDGLLFEAMVADGQLALAQRRLDTLRA